MPDFKEITAKDNRLIKLTSLLQKSAKARKENGLFVLEGLRICVDAAENGIVFDTLILTKSMYQKANDDVTFLCQNANSCVMISDDLFKKISDTTSPQGIIAICAIPKGQTVVNKSGRFVALENMADPSNIGAVSRSAEALGIDGIIISGDSCDIYSPKVLRASMGTILRMPVYFCEDIISFIDKNSLRGFACVVEDNADCRFGEVHFSDGDVVIIGNEANGLTMSTRKRSYKTITISMQGRAESLNAASAAAIAMWELIK